MKCVTCHYNKNKINQDITDKANVSVYTFCLLSLCHSVYIETCVRITFITNELLEHY